SLSSADPAHSCRPVATAGLRVGGEFQSLRRQGSSSPARRAPCLLLLHADALCLASTPCLFRGKRERISFRPPSSTSGWGRCAAKSDACPFFWTPSFAQDSGGRRILGYAAELGPAHRGPGHAFCRHQPDRAATHRGVLWKNQRAHLSASQYRFQLSGTGG